MIYQNTDIFHSHLCSPNCFSSRKAIIVTAVDSQFDFSPRFSNSSNQTMDFSISDELFSDPCSGFSSYHCLRPRAKFFFAQGVNASITNKSLNYCSHSCSSLLFVFLFSSTSKSLFLSGQTKLVADRFWICSFWPGYSHDSSQHINTKGNIKTMNQ